MRRIAVIGLGHWGQRVIGKLNRDQIVSVLVTNPAKHTSPLPLVSSFDALAESRPSHVYVLSPIPCLRDHAMQALYLGANVFVEKPFTYCDIVLTDVARRLSENSTQKLHVNHLFKYSALLDDWQGIAPVRLNLRWHKFSLSAFSIEDNLLPHAITILLMVFGLAAPVELRKKRVGQECLQLDLMVKNIEVQVNISVSTKCDTTQIMTLTCEGRDSSRQFDLLRDPADKLQRSINAFFGEATTERMENFNLHCAIACIMRRISDFEYTVNV